MDDTPHIREASLEQQIIEGAVGMPNTIIRAPQRQRFLVIDQRTVEDTGLSWAARGMLAYLLSRPDTWKVRITDLRRRGNLGRDGTYKLINELRSAGYMDFQQGRDRQGRIRGGDYIVRELPNPPHPELPDTDPPDLAAPHTVDPDALPTTEINLIPSTTTTTYNTKERYSTLDERTDSIVFPNWISPELQLAAREKVARFDSTRAQMVIDEWAGAIEAGKIKKSHIGYLHELAARLDRGQFRCHHADDNVRERKANRVMG